MPTWNEIVAEIEATTSATAADDVRKKYLTQLSEKTDRPVIAYYSGWLQRKGAEGKLHPEVAITDLDVNGFMSAIYGLSRDAGVDLVLHTPGGDIEATRAIVEYLIKMFGRDIRVIVPQAALSAGTMIACASRSILMGKHSCLGPTDPQVQGLPALVVIAEIDKAIEEIKKDAHRQLVWQQVFAKYPPGFIANCERARDVTRELVKNWLQHGMLSDEEDPSSSAEKVINKLMDVSSTTSHSYHFMVDDCKMAGLKIELIENNQDLQEAVLSVHHSFMASFNYNNSIKLIQNSNGVIWAID